MVPGSVPEKREENEHRILAAGGKTVPDDPSAFPPYDELLLLHLGESAGEHSRRKPGIVPLELTEPAQMQERHVPDQEERPSSTEATDALPERVALVGEHGDDRSTAGVIRGASPRHYPPRPYGWYILSKG